MNKYLQFVQDSSGHDTVLLIDTSPSQDARDLKPTRLRAAIAAIIAMLEVLKERFPRDRVGIVSFNGKAEVIHPLDEVGKTFKSLKQAVKRLETNSSTNITAGLETAGKLLRARNSQPLLESRGLVRLVRKMLFEDQGHSSRRASTPSHHLKRGQRIILTSDGCHNTGRKPIPVARSLKDQGVEINVIGVGGSPTGSEFNEEELKSIASEHPDGTPMYVFIRDTSSLIKEFQRQAFLRPVKE